MQNAMIIPVLLVSLGVAVLKRIRDQSSLETCIRYYAESVYGFTLTSAQIDQLKRLQGNAFNTPHSADQARGLNIEIKRSLDRLYHARLFRSGKQKDHQVLIQEQPMDRQLALPHFNQLSQLIQGLPEADYEALEASCLMTMSDDTKAQLSAYPEDSEAFLTEISQSNPVIWPVCKALNPAAQKRLSKCFLPYHIRHMVFTEGGHRMYEGLAQEPLADRKLWVARWVINIAGFLGHMNPRNSFLTNEWGCKLGVVVSSCLQTLSGIKPLDHYLHQMMDHHQCHKEGEFLAHLMCLADLQNPKDIESAKNWYRSLLGSTQKKLSQWYQRFKDIAQAPTYLPAILFHLSRKKGLKVSQWFSYYCGVIIPKIKLDIGDHPPQSFKAAADLIPGYLPQTIVDVAGRYDGEHLGWDQSGESLVTS